MSGSVRGPSPSANRARLGVEVKLQRGRHLHQFSERRAVAAGTPERAKRNEGRQTLRAALTSSCRTSTIRTPLFTTTAGSPYGSNALEPPPYSTPPPLPVRLTPRT